MTETKFSDLGLIEQLLRTLAERELVTPTPIQAKAIPLLLDGGDLIGIAQTGTGKTAAFALPILQYFSEERRPRQSRAPRALVLAPTRELAVQIEETFHALGKGLGLTSALVLGGVSRGGQIKALARGVDILIATPGRLLDLYMDRHIDFNACEVLVLDEADRMLDMGFIRDVRKIVKAIPDDRQTMLFSATMPREVELLAREILEDPAKVEVTPERVAADRIEQSVVFADQARKRAVLAHLLRQPEFARAIVFTRTKHGANRVCEQLERAGISAEAIHGNKSQNARQRALEMFKTGKVGVLVATDIAARGVHIDSVTHVINYELPAEAESYVHRIGRTARAGASGAAITLCAPGERAQLKAIERLTRNQIPVITLDVPAIVEGPKPARDDDDERSERPARGRSSRDDRPARNYRNDGGRNGAVRSEGGRSEGGRGDAAGKRFGGAGRGPAKPGGQRQGSSNAASGAPQQRTRPAAAESHAAARPEGGRDARSQKSNAPRSDAGRRNGGRSQSTGRRRINAA